MNPIPMTVAELIEHLHGLPQGRQIFLHDREPLTREDLFLRGYDFNGQPRLIIGRIYKGDCCRKSDACIHYQQEL